MNKSRFRLLFNKIRGFLMAVPETSRHAVGHTRGNNEVHHRIFAALRPLYFGIMLALGLVCFSPAHAQIVANPNAAAQYRPGVSAAANGVTVVNIQSASKAGVSRNQYSQFDVTRQGVILNNARTNAQTQLGGWIQGNPNLAGGTARVILNEVNSSNPSLLKGFVEVGGSRAQVVIANPSGLQVDGLGFINADRATLTTGVPVMNAGGGLDGFSVKSGAVTITGAGLDARQTDYTDIIARSVEINAGIWANQLKLTTGANQVSADHTQVTPIAADADESKPAFSIDVAALGGMYAGKIFLVGTEQGVGVRNAGHIGAAAGEVVITADGRLHNKGHIGAVASPVIVTTQGSISNSGEIMSGAGDVRITSGGNIRNTGEVLSAGALNIESAGEMRNRGRIAGDEQVTLASGSTLTNFGTLESPRLDITANHIANAAEDSRMSADDLALSGVQLSNRGTINGGARTFIQTELLDNIGTGRIYGDHLAVAANTINNVDENGKSPVIAARNRLDIGVQTLNNRENALLFSAGDMNIGGSLTADRYATGTANTINNNSASIEALDNLNISVNTLNNTNEHLTTQMVEEEATHVVEYALVNSPNRYDQKEVTHETAEIQYYLYSVNDYGDGTGEYLPREPEWYSLTLDPYAGNYAATRRRLDEMIAKNASDAQKGLPPSFGINHLYSEYYDMLHTPEGSSNAFHWYEYDRSIAKTVITSSAPGKVTAGGNIRIDAGTLTNRDSQIVAGGALQISAGSLNNLETAGTVIQTESGAITYVHRHDGPKYGVHSHFDSSRYTPAPVSTQISLNESRLVESQPPPGNGTPVAENAADTVTVGETGGRVQITLNSLFSVKPTTNYWIEADPRFADYRQWLSSDYMLTQLGLNPAEEQKRLGDGYYEQQLIRDQITQLTGRRFLEGYADDEAQYRALLDGGVTLAKAWDLRPGIALTEAQVAQLTSDIVWLVAQEVTLPDGTVTSALVPRIYLAPGKGDLTGNGALIAANTLDLNISGDVNNQGTIAGREVLSLNAENINNLGGRMTGAAVQVSATNDINNIGGTIDAQKSLQAVAGNNINLISTTNTTQNAQGSNTHINRVAGLYVTGDTGGTLLAVAGNDMNLTGAQIINASQDGQTALVAGNNINMNTVQTGRTDAFRLKKWRLEESTTEQVGTTVTAKGSIAIAAGNDINAQKAGIGSYQGDIILTAGNDINLSAATDTWNTYNTIRHGRKKGYTDIRTTQENGTTIQSGTGNIQLQANHDINAKAAYISSENAGISLIADNNINLSAATDTYFREDYTKSVKKGALSKKTTITRDVLDTTTSQGTIISGNTVDVQAGQNINVTGSHLVSTEGTTLLAGNDINLVNATDSRYENHYKKVKKSGLMSGGGLGVTIGSQTQSLDRKDTLYTASASTVGATEGNVNLIAGNTYTQKGSHVQAPEGDVNILAKRVDITDATETRHSTSEYRFKQSGLSISLSNPVLDAIQTGMQMASASRKADDGRMTALAVANTGLAANVAYDAVKAGQGDANGKIATKNSDGTPVKNADGTPAESDATAASQAGGITISVTVGTSKSESKTTIDATNSAPSTVTAGNNVTIAAVGDTENSDLTVRGSDINAGNNILLAADNNINLLASANTTEQHSTSKNSSAALGVAIQIGQGVAFGITASASMGRGTADGSDVVWKNTHVNAGNTAELVSGNDTNLVGAVVNARQVVADVGNNLNITSLQDTSEYHSKSQSAGGSVTIGYGFAGSASYSQSKANSSYASVVEQSGIRAGDGGFQVAVANNTDLSGAVIASTDKAASEGKNRLTTGSLTTSDLHNHSKASASSSGLSADSSMFSGSKYATAKGIISNAIGYASDSTSSSGDTRSAVSEGTILITDPQKQEALTGQTAEETVASLNRDTDNAHHAAQKQDAQALEEALQKEQQLKKEFFNTVSALTDETFRIVFIESADVYALEKDENDKTVKRKLSDEEKYNLQPGEDGKVRIATNGIFNDPDQAAEYAMQNAGKNETVYLVYFPEANNVVSELMVAAYQKLLEGDTLGLSNATQEIKNFMSTYGGEDGTGVIVDGHSRGGMTIGNALESLSNVPDSTGLLKNTLVNLFGSAANAQQMDVNLSDLQGRTLKDEEDKRIRSVVHIADWIGTFIGGNPATGGVIPADSSRTEEAVKVLFSSISAHNCYGSGKAGCEKYWNVTGTPGLPKP